MTAGRRATSAVLLAVASVLLVSCGDTGAAGGPADLGDDIDHDRMYAVAGDEDATPREIVEAGRAIEAAHDGAGHVMVVYTVHNDDDEGLSQAAWRVYDDEGDVVAEGPAGTTEEGYASAEVEPLADGFVLREEGGRSYVVTGAGDREKLATVRPQAPRPGDVPFSGFGYRVLRPSVPEVFRSTADLPHNPQGWALAADGTEWLHRVSRSVDAVPRIERAVGDGWETVAPIPIPPGQYVGSLTLTAAGEWVAVAIFDPDDQDYLQELVAFAVRPTGAPADEPWRMVDASDVDTTDSYGAMIVGAVGGTLVVDPVTGQAPYLVDVATGGIAQLRPPTDEEGWYYEPRADGLYASNGRHAAARFSPDLGRTWEQLPH